jgi:SAM-dependent methyltransferase
VKLSTLFENLPHARTQLAIGADGDTFVRLHFLYAAKATGLLDQLHEWTGRDGLVKTLGVQQPELLDALLELGVALKEFACDGERYRLRGARAKAFATPDGDALAALVEEYVTYHGPAYRELAARMLDGAPPGDYLNGRGQMIARSSRIFEPFVRDFVETLVAGAGALNLLEIGCGSGVYLHYAAQANPQARGIGIDLQADVVRATSANLRTWGLDTRFTVMQADIRVPPGELNGPFDLLTLYNNIYYFPVAERPALLRGLHARLAPGGRLALVSVFQAPTVSAASFDLMLRSTAGCAPLPRLDELIVQLHDADFGEVRTSRLMPGQPFYGVVASATAAGSRPGSDRSPSPPAG